MPRIIQLAVILVLGSGSSALAENPGADWLTPAQTKQALKAAGYTDILKLEADDGHWDGEGIKDGRRMKFDADPRTGAVLGEVPAE
ncbi:hypothetical protein PMNALOAF_3293 [Methylobacterium adhaesivum]|uniref:PepSY domain-containing protein n=1 Tax=Methylobacterium adhaesivum TaxID=333297 RepID=A0ABT8BAU4_9HYPH|nr:PepSY domain-containing protein [Methylobacterium adhaesivum]MDN3589142.1 PepSY domain-containing protein [Methylobacterium adhaesivum]GJD32028.1 hypothetical protein PMNALOAF_3293 [Methylobacterium adhaesivum]